MSTPLRERPDAPLGTLIFRAGLLPAETIESALEEGVKTGKRLGEILVERGLLKEVDLARLLAGQKGLEFVTVREQIVDPGAASLFTPEQARLFRALPYAFENDLPVVAIPDPTDEVLTRNIREALGRDEVRFVVSTRGELAEIVEDVYSRPLAAPADSATPPAAPAPQPEPAPAPVEAAVEVAPETELQPLPPVNGNGAGTAPEAETQPAPPPAEPVVHEEPVQVPPAPAPVVEPAFVQPSPAQPSPIDPPPAPAPAPPLVPDPPAEPIAPVATEPTGAPEPAPAPEPVLPAEPQPPVVSPAPEPLPLQVPAPSTTPPGEPYPPAAAQPAPAAPDGPPGEPAYRVTVRLVNGERVEAGTFPDLPSAQECAKTLMAQVAAAAQGEWPFVSGRFLKPDTIVSVDIAEHAPPS